MLFYSLDGTLLGRLDVWTEHSVTYSGELTSHPVERLPEEADHFTPDPIPLTGAGILTDAPLDGSGYKGRAREIFDTMGGVAQRGTPLTVLVADRALTPYILTNWKGVMGRGRVDVQLELKQLRVATLREVELPPTVKQQGGAGRVDAGSIATADMTAQGNGARASSVDTQDGSTLTPQDQLDIPAVGGDPNLVGG